MGGDPCAPDEPTTRCDGVDFRPCTPREGTSGATLLRGTIVTPDRVLCDGDVLIERDTRKVACVGVDCSGHAAAANASVVCADVVMPGIIDPHNHMSYNTLPRYRHAGPTFTNRGQWGGIVAGDMYDARFGGNHLVAGRYSEFRLLMAGTTSVHKSSAVDSTFNHVRNLDRRAEAHGLGYSDDAFVECIHPLRSRDCEEAPDYGSGDVPMRAFVGHVSEGTDREAYGEFPTFAEAQLGPRTAIVHCVSCDGPQLSRVKAAGAKIVWSPQSNIDLYGETTDVATAKRMGITVALGPDWTPSGTMNQLSEMKCAKAVSDRSWEGALTARDIVRMVTDHAAEAMGVADLVGRLEPGHFADVVAITGDRRRPYEAILSAGNPDVRAVFIGGVLFYGDDEVFDETIALNDLCEPVDVCGGSKRVCVKQQPGEGNLSDDGNWSRFTLVDHIDFLQTELDEKRAGSNSEDYIFDLYPLFECEPTFACDIGNARISGAPSAGDADGDEIADGDDNCPGVFNPGQGDLDGDGEGDGCDACPFAVLACPCAAPAPDDADADGTRDEDDNCPTLANEDQADGDADGTGDACDHCPDIDNRGGVGCPGTVYALKRGEYDDREGRPTAVWGQVTAIDLVEGEFLFMQVPEGAPGFEGLDHSAVYVYLGNAVNRVTVPAIGECLTVHGVANNFFGQRQLMRVARLDVEPCDYEIPYVEVTTDEVGSGGARADALEAARVVVRDARVTSVMLESGPGDRDPNSEYELDERLRVNDLFYRTDPFPEVGDTLDFVRGQLRFANGNSKLEPTGRADVGRGPPSIETLAPALSFISAGAEGVPTGASGAPLTILLSGPAPGGGERVELTSDAPEALAVDAVVVPEGEISAVVSVRGLAQHMGAVVTARIEGRGEASARVRVVGDDEMPSQLEFEPEEVVVAAGAEVVLRLSLDLPAPAGFAATIEVEPELLEGAPEVAFEAGRVFVGVPLRAGDEAGIATVVARAGALRAEAEVEVVAFLGGGEVVVNEVNYDMAGDETQEFVELYNGSAVAVMLDGWLLEFVNGSNNQPYLTTNLAGVLPPGGYALVADPTVDVPEGVLGFGLPGRGHDIQNGPDAVRLVDAIGEFVDGVAYGGAVDGAGEGEVGPGDQNDDAGSSIGRCPNGADSDDNAADFRIGAASPGAPNSCP